MFKIRNEIVKQLVKIYSCILKTNRSLNNVLFRYTKKLQYTLRTKNII